MRLQYQPMQNRNFSCLSNCQKIMMSASSWTIFFKNRNFKKNFPDKYLEKSVIFKAIQFKVVKQ